MTLQDKLYKLRRDKGWSQEELAELLDVSRQAVSKWERGESSPDTNNLIRIAKLYDIPVDSLARSIRGEESVKFDPEPKKGGISLKKPSCAENAGTADDFIRMDIPDAPSDDGEIYPERKPAADIPRSTPLNNYSSIGAAYTQTAYTAPPQKKKGKLRSFISKLRSAPDPVRAAACAKFKKFPFWALMLLMFFFFGGMFDLWECSWLFFLLIPIYYTSIKAYERRNMNYFCYPLIATVAFFGFGFLFDFMFGWIGSDLWSASAIFWFMSIPLYYTGIAAYRHKNCKYFAFPVLAVMAWLLIGIMFNHFVEFLWLFALIPFYYIYSSDINRIIFKKRQ